MRKIKEIVIIASLLLVFSSCKLFEVDFNPDGVNTTSQIPILTTNVITDITKTNASTGGNITSAGLGAPITERGVCWNTTGIPQITDFKTTDGSGIGIFTSNITGLTANTLYYARAYAINNAGIAYGSNEVSFTTALGVVNGPNVDFDNYTYHSVVIGTQTWMIENLRNTHLRDGSAISVVTDNTAWFNLTTSACCNYNNDATMVMKYGKLYNWYAVNTGKLAPAGWHVPSDAEWTTLENYVRANQGTSGSVAKALAASTDWTASTNVIAIGNELTKNNSSGFSALPGGLRKSYYGTFYDLGTYGYYWSATEFLALYAYYRILGYDSSGIGRNDSERQSGFSVRCLKD